MAEASAWRENDRCKDRQKSSYTAPSLMIGRPRRLRVSRQTAEEETGFSDKDDDVHDNFSVGYTDSSVENPRVK